MKKLLVIMAALAAEPSLAADAGSFGCPDDVTVAPAIVADHQGWSASEPPELAAVRHPFSAATFSDGPPREKAMLRPEISDDEKTESYDAASVSDLWLVCLYADTDAYLARKIEGSPARCDVSVGATASSAVTCR